MKKYLVGLFFLVVAGIFSCKKIDDSSLFDKTADQRLTESLAAYEAKLIGATNGWVGLLTTQTGAINTFYFKFNADNRVQMLSSFDSTSAVTLKESSYRVKALQQPSLIFDTYSYIHVLSDPNNSISGGTNNVGQKSDFEFYFEDTASTADQITLVGRFNGSKLVLTRATAAEATAFTSGQLAAGLQINKILTYYTRIVINNTDSADFRINRTGASVAGVDAQGNLLDANLKTSYILKLGGLGFLKAITVGTKTVTEITNMSYNAATGIITATIGGAPAVIKPVVVPIKVDVTAAKRFWDYAVSQAGTGARSISGFFVNGVQDAYKWSSIPGYTALWFLPKFGTSGGINYDLIGPIVNNNLSYGAAYRPPVFTADGRMTYTLLGNLGTAPAAQTSAYVSTRNQLGIPQGYYVVQVGSLSYDMVSAADGKAWINWFFI